MFGWFSQDSASHAQLDDDVESAFSDLNDPTPQSSDTGLSDHVPLTYLPTLAIESSRRDLPNRLVKSTSIQSITCTGSTKEDQNALVENWARLLHIYTVAEDVAFAVTGLATPRLILSHWPSTSRSLTQDENPRITSTPFDNSKHQAKVNTAIDLGKDYALNQEFDFVLRWSGDHFSDVQLYINHSNVPQKFASAVWSTFAELSAPVKTTDTQRRLKASISRADRRAISSWVPDPIYESQTCLHQLFLDSVHQVPEDNAVEAWDGSLTYAKLNLFSDRVASQLLQKGLRRGQYVPFSFEKSMWMVVAVLGILKAGGAMVPIDPSQPQARVQEIMNQTNASLVVASASQSVAFAHLFDTVEVSSHTLRNDRPNSDQTNHTLPQMRSGEPALVLFTSGSTGKPKGIVIEHGAIATRMLVEGRAFHYRGARTLQFAATTWDIFMTDVFTTLTYQGCICIPNEQDRRLNLSRFCKDFNVTLALMTPTLASILDPAAFPTLKTLIFGGEALQQDVVSKWSFPNGPRIFQGYGPAETGPCVTGRVAERPEILGTPLENSLCVLVDPNNHEKLVPLGAIGELVVGGPSLLREYIGNSSITSLATLDNPSWVRDLDTSVTHFYRTGDLLRYSIDTMDGSLEFVGRKDDQVKYHGQRIELKEIEHHLNKIPEVESSTVILVRKGCFKDKLVAVVQCIGHRAQHNTCGTPSIVQDSGFNYSKMRSSLSPRLPDYMIPNELIVVDRLPHTSSMKLDKSHITNWISDMQKSLVERTAEKLVNTSKLLPDEETAMAIAAEYARIVAGDHESRRVSFEGNDFNLQSGGIDSIQIMSLSWYLSRRYAVQIPIADMLSSKATVRTLASTIDAKRGSQVAQKRSTPLGVLNEVSQQLDRLDLGEIPHYENSKVQRVFVTGSSGFLGIEILRQLLTLSGCHVYALVRGPSREGTRNRLIARARAVGWWQEVFSARLDVWTGDLTKPQIGLTDGQWAMLQAQTTPSIDAIIHNGAKVHYNMDYESLKTTNVSSTVELLKAVRSRQRPLYSFVFVSGGQELRFDDQETTKAANQSGYARSKVVSELIVKKFARQQDSKARHVRVIKPGFIIGDSKQGLANQTDFLWRLVAASIDLGYYNESDSENWLFVADVARVSTSILDGIFEDHGKPVTQVLDGIRFRDLWVLLKDRFGYELEPLTSQRWLDKLQQAVADKREQHVMFPLMYMLEANDALVGVRGRPHEPTSDMDSALLANVAQLIKTGFLPQPPIPILSTNNAPLAVDAFDVESVRKQFPALQQGIVPFNNAAGTALLQSAIDRTQWYMSSIPIELGRDDPESIKKTERLGNNYKELAAFMNADADEIAFGQTTTFLFRALGQALRPLLNSDCEMVVSNLCHEASAAAWIALAKDLNIAIKWWAPPPGDDPCLSLETLKPLLTAKTRIVTCNHVSNVVGTCHPIRQVADMVHQIPGAILIVDGVAWAPHRPIDVKALDVDFYCFSWYKVFGPHIAQLYGRRSTQKRVLAGISHYFLSDMPGLDWRLRLGTNTFELEEALVPIAHYLQHEVGWEKIIAQEVVLQETLLNYLRRRPQHFRIFGEKSSDPEKRVSVITFEVIGRSCNDVTNQICRKGRFRVVSGNCWAPRPTHDVLKLGPDGLIRVSFVHYNTVAEVHEFCQELDSIVRPVT
ncbi:putative nonribosomal peptide synthase [Aureobasidium pullulans]|uniref:Putative nonribosomal peptide synthase n=1 Tax=Aureobasidium pullulans TaxID=5580 RepID=A0A4V4LEQ6_AURPU|nr:putative nonribosomal peptide synthase [Aureobasidium pullulans]